MNLVSMVTLYLTNSQGIKKKSTIRENVSFLLNKMNFLTCKLLNDEETQLLRKNLHKDKVLWEDGKKTAGKQAAKVKFNLQLNKESDISRQYSNFIIDKMLNNPLIKSFTLPKIIHGGMFTKALEGMKYGRHIDNAFMSSGRSDLSFTIFLSPKNGYDGGELKIENINSEEEYKLDQGEIIIYPSTYLHSVNKIETGERLVFVGWIESYVKSIEEREYLFDLDAAARSLLSKYGRTY